LAHPWWDETLSSQKLWNLLIGLVNEALFMMWIDLFNFALTNYFFACNVWFSDLRWSMKLRGVVLETKPLMDEMR